MLAILLYYFVDQTIQPRLEIIHGDEVTVCDSAVGFAFLFCWYYGVNLSIDSVYDIAV